MSRVGKKMVAPVATTMCIIFMLSIALPLSGAQGADTTPPVTNVSVSGTAGNNGWYKASPTAVTLNAVDDSSGVAHTYYRLDGGAQVEYTSNFTVPDGNHTLAFWSVDNAGNTESLSAGRNYLSFKVDTGLPVVNMTINGKYNSSTGNYYTTTTVNLTASDNCSGISSIQYSFDNAIWTLYSGNITIPDGVNTLYYGSFDNAGNAYNNTTVIRVFNPIILTNPPYNTWYDHYLYNIQFVKPASDDVKYVQYTYGYQNTWYTYDMDAPVPFSIFDNEGNRSIEYKAIGRSGDISETHKIWFGIDISPPWVDCSIEGDRADQGWWNGDIKVHINAHDNGSISHTEWSWDNASWNNYDGPFKLSNQKSKTIYYRTTDMMGRMAYGNTFIYFAPKSFDQGSMSNSNWINGSMFGPTPGPSDENPENPTPRPTADTVPLPTPSLVPSPSPQAQGSTSPLAIGVLVGVVVLIGLAAIAAYLFVFKPK